MLSSRAAAAGWVPATAGGPRLLMPEPEDRRSSWIAGSLTTGLHLAALAVLLLLAWMAPPVEELIQVKIIRELPGADAEPAPARKQIQPRRAQRAPARVAQRVAARAVTQPRVVNVAPQRLDMNRVDQARAPRQVERRQVTSTRTQARSIDQRRVAADLDLSKLQDVRVAPTDLRAPVVDTGGPREIDPGAAMQSPQSFSDLTPVEEVDYRSAAPVAVVSDEDLSAAGSEAFEFDTDVGAYATSGGSGTGGTGTAEGVVPCLQSAFVVRYLDDVEARMQKRWQVPEGVPDGTEVKLRFQLDGSGAATRVRYDESTDPVLGNSAVAALRAASPFRMMDDHVRCLAGKPLAGIFSVSPL